MKQITLAGLIIAMLGLITSNSVWARDEGGHGGGFGGSFGGNGKHYSRSLGYYGSFYYSQPLPILNESEGTPYF